MKTGPICELRIALIGYVSAGKTTVLNAIFREKYGEVAMSRTTAGINYFRISPSLSKKQDEGTTGANANQDNTSSSEINKSNKKWSSVADDPRSAKSVLEEISQDNLALRSLSTVQEKHFDIELNDELFEMRKGTRLVLVDVPGINEAGSSSMYKDYVRAKWHTFDCVVVVMDGRQGVNTDEQMNLLKFVKENQENRELPVIILCNKIDVPEDAEQQVLVTEVREAVEAEFNAENSESRLKQVLLAVSKKDDNKEEESNESKALEVENPYPLFITISAIHAFIFQSASMLSFEEFQNFDKGLIEKFGREYFGQKWTRLSQDQKYENAYEALSDPEEQKLGLEASNFDKFLGALAYTFAGQDRQLELIKKQLDDAMTRLVSSENLMHDLKRIYVLGHSMDLNVDHLKARFWSFFVDTADGAFAKFDGPTHVDSLAVPMDMLLEYHELCLMAGWKEEIGKIVREMKCLVQRQIGGLLEHGYRWKMSNWRKAIKKWSLGKAHLWETLSPAAWQTMLGSILLVEGSLFCIHFGQEKLALECLLHESRLELNDLFGQVVCPVCPLALDLDLGYIPPSSDKGGSYPAEASYASCYDCKHHFHLLNDKVKNKCAKCDSKISGNKECGSCHFKTHSKIAVTVKSALAVRYKPGGLTPVHPIEYKRLNSIDVPQEGPSNPFHFGHLQWKFCRFLETNPMLSTQLINNATETPKRESL